MSAGIRTWELSTTQGMAMTPANRQNLNDISTSPGPPRV
jgi:hypothetical protein